jgi:hypothetical protein
VDWARSTRRSFFWDSVKQRRRHTYRYVNHSSLHSSYIWDPGGLHTPLKFYTAVQHCFVTTCLLHYSGLSLACATLKVTLLTIQLSMAAQASVSSSHANSPRCKAAPLA